VDVLGLIEQLDADGARVTALCGTTAPGAPVPTCPGWGFRDLVHHLGGVHRWATTFVGGDHGQPRDGDLEVLSGGWPEDGDLAGWFAEGHADLVRALRGAPADLETWAFLEAPTPLAFWARRQAHETAIHRVDAESASGATSGFPAGFAADGVDELLLRFVARGGRPLPVERERTLAIAATDLDRAWTVTFAPEGFRTTAGAEPGGVETRVRGTASELYVWLWNRSSTDDLERTGDEEPLRLWRDHARVTWT
jgi:uncharacterized protein (TIGR03083 family)